MSDVFVLGSFTTAFGRLPDVSHHQLAREAALGAAADAGLDGLGAVEGTWFGSCAIDQFGQPNIRGQAVLLPLVKDGALAPFAPIVNVEAGCATGGVALHGAYTAVASGEVALALALGVEKTFIPSAPQKMLALFEGGLDQLDPSAWRAACVALGQELGAPFEPRPDRVTIVDLAALEAAWHMKTWGTTARALATVSSKNHAHGALNPKAQYRKAMSVEAVLADKPVVGPLTRAMCSPIGDGAAAVLLASERCLAQASPAQRARAVRVAACALANGARFHPSKPSGASHAARRAFARAKVTPAQVQVAELHDATAFAELAALEALGFCAPGQSGPFTESGATALGGRLPVNPSGGLESRGHPLAATGLAQVTELRTQLLGEAGERQVKGAALALAHNAGGMIGLDEAMSAVTILERAQG